MRWTKKEDEALQKYKEEGLTNREIALRLRRSTDAVRSRAAVLASPQKNRRWTREEVEILLKLRQKPKKYISKVINRSIQAIYQKLAELDKTIP